MVWPFGKSAEQLLLEQLVWQQNRIRELLATSNDLQRETHYLLRRQIHLSRPRKLIVRIVREIPGEGENGMDQIVFRVDLEPLVTPNDVVERRVQVVIDGVATDKVLGKDETDAGEYKGPEDATAEVILVDVDNKGNASPAVTTGEFTLADTFAPTAPGVPNVTFVREEVTDDTVAGGGGGTE